MKAINRFQEPDGTHLPLSNFYPSRFLAPYPFRSGDKVEWKTVEHYFQAAKATDLEGMDRIRLASSPGQAKRKGREVIFLRPNWDSVKLDVMRNALNLKFARGSHLASYLLSTEDAILIDGNTSGDVYWGKCKGKGQNWLGWLLAAQRDYLRCMATNVTIRNSRGQLLI